MMRSGIASFNRFGGSFAKRLIGSILGKQRLFLVSPRRGHAGRTVEQLGTEQFVAQPALRLEHPAVPAASRTRHGAAQQARAWGLIRKSKLAPHPGF
jgi:hypothetical protein